MEFRQLRYFIAVAEELHFRRAAELVHIAQPALSQQIKLLEAEIGTPLFERNHHNVQLTEAGKAFYPKAVAILAAAQQAVTDVRAVEQGEAGTVRVGFISSAALSVIPQLLTHFRQHFPLVKLELDELSPGEQIDALYREKIELGFLHAKLEEELFETFVVSREKMMVAVPAASDLTKLAALELRDLARETIIMPARHATSGYFEVVRSAFFAAGVKLEHIHHTRLLQTGLSLVGAGLGVSLVPESFARIQVEGMVYRPLANESPTIELIAAWRRDNRSPLFQRITNEIKALSQKPAQ